MGSDDHHESNHGSACRAKYSGIPKCMKAAGVNLTVHETDHGQKAVYLRSINGMNFPNFIYSLRVID